jgi:type I restriction enzyme M protein
MATDLSKLQNKLWEAADQLRATSSLKSSEYAAHLLGFIFLRYADQRFADAVCRVDVPASSKPIRATFKKAEPVLFERRNNSTRQVPADGVESFIAERFGN